VVNLDPADPIRLDYSIRRGEPGSFVMGIPRIGGQQGGKAALWKDDEISLVIARKSCEFIERNKDKRFFLKVATHNIHVPRVPNRMFVGKSDCGPRGDAIVEFDWTVGQILDKLDQLGLHDRTLVILSSDNGGINDNNGPDKVHGIGDPDATNGHPPNGVLRGHKGTLWEGGTREPMLVRWPGRIQPGTSDALMSQLDLLASLAALTGQTLPPGQAPDSENHLKALLGESRTGREYLIEQSNGGWPLALRHGPWKLIPQGGNLKAGGKYALYNLADDLSETKDLAASHPDKVAAMTAKLAEISRLPQAAADGPAAPQKRGKRKANPSF
jgi:arylsulfatase A-like enzyme